MIPNALSKMSAVAPGKILRAKVRRYIGRGNAMEEIRGRQRESGGVVT